MTTRSSIAVLTVARWYPSHDSPGRGSFVADLVDATRAYGVDHVVASFELLRVAPLGGDGQFVDKLVADATTALRPPDDPTAALARPLHWGARGVPVARLAIPRPPAADGPAMLELHDATFGPWADRLVATWRPDLIHAHTGIPDGIVAARLGRRHGIPVLVTEHASTIERELEPPTTRAQYLELADRVDVVAVSRSLAGRLQRALRLEHEIDVLPNPVDEESFPASRDRRRSNELLWVGAMAAHKGTLALLRAFALARVERPDLTLRVIGRPASGTDDVYRDLAAGLGVAGAVAFDGWADRAAVAEAMRRASVFVHPSPSETFGVVAAEAILSGLPVATAPSGGVPEILETAGGFGAVAGDPSPEALAAAIESVLERRDALDPQAARARIVESYGRAAVAQRVCGRYEQLVGRDRPERSVSRRAPASRPPLTSPVVVATSPGWLSASLAPAPDGFRQSLTVVAPVAADDEGNRGAQPSIDSAAVGRLVAVPIDELYAARQAVLGTTRGRVRARIESLGDRIRRRRRRGPRERLRDERPALRLAALGQAVQELSPSGGDGTPDVFVADATAAAAIARASGSGRKVSGGVRSLADRWSESSTTTAQEAPA